jgi:CRP-like cAMP-binding protein
MNVFTERETRIFSKALTEVTVVSASKEEVRELVGDDPSIVMGLLNYFSEKHEDVEL